MIGYEMAAIGRSNIHVVDVNGSFLGHVFYWYDRYSGVKK